MINSTKNKDKRGDYSVKPQHSACEDDEQSIIHLTIPIDCAGLRFDQALAKLLPDWSRSRLQTWIEAHQVTLDGRSATPKQKIWGGERIQVSPQEMAVPSVHAAEAIDLNIVDEDDTLIVINKPAGLVTHPGNGNWQGTLLNALLHHAPQLEYVPRAGIVHRLDKDTGGLLVVAKTIEAQTSLVRQLQQRTVKREYMALVHGFVEYAGSIEAPIGRHPVHRTRMAITSNGKPSHTHYRPIETFEGCTLVQCNLETGRTHQIRVHMQSIGHPLIGDPVYGGKPQKNNSNSFQWLTDFPRQALHAQKLALIHPKTGKLSQWEAAIPEDMQNLLTALRKCNDRDKQ